MPAYRTREHASRISTDPLPPPTVAIISPTPRAFTFPINTDAPYASPSASPFEPDLKASRTPPLPRAFSPTSSIGSDASSALSTPSSARSSQVSQKRRRSAASDIGERRPKKGDDDYIKRPENAFILFRRKCCEDRQAQDEADEQSGPVKKQRQADLSKTISQQWKSLSTEERQYWEELAKEKKKEHEAMYPNYVYRPQRSKDKAKAKKGKGKKADEEQEEADNSISFVLPVPSPPRSLSRDSAPVSRSHNRRAVSAPTPPPIHQTIQLPSVFMPSCPTSPSRASYLLPRISGRSPNPHIPPPSDNDPLTRYEYLPNDSLFPSNYQPSTAFAHGPSVDELYQMFQAEQPPVPSAPQQTNGVLLHSLTIPGAPSLMSSSVVSPTDTIASSQYFPSVDSFASPISPTSPQNGPFTPADTLSMMSLSLANGQQNGMMQDALAELHAKDLSYSAFTWPEGSLWPADTMIPDDFDLNSIPPIELGISQFDGEMQQLCGLSGDGGASAAAFDFDGGDFSSLGQEYDFHDAHPGHDPAAMFTGYDPQTNW
ncbi:uncharacterized protein LAESUDRAFT_133265 [Laetiporus sulphureus 93-53]|uniref:HMG box domain-containing protein n=1 Tax=Laetiporus sulphureus 93-53 TaxID=1314785 RepID=A0A165EIE2_9APHY|nr:uncharacterized protein LAESUDRAFT_133265 [Laetiporus sulphureus 93-53]KZT07116.1 hypothetical protein LAESUDRAFT_133265 [Laetiporus sulphureus 93-53]